MKTIITILVLLVTLISCTNTKPIDNKNFTGIDATGRTYINGKCTGVIPNH